MSSSAGPVAGREEDRIVIEEQLWQSGQPVRFSPARIYFSKRKLETAVDMGGAKPGARVLEVGCTSGTFTFPMQRLGFHVTGFDVDAGALDKARSYAREHGLEGISFEQGDAHDLSRFPDDTFDHVFSFQCYRYLADLDKALSEVLRVLKPGGTSCIDYPNRYSPFYAIFKKVKGHAYQFQDYSYLGKREAEQRYRRLGFRRADARTFLFSPPTTPAPLLPVMKGLDVLLEPTPGIRALAGIVMVRGEK